MNSVTFNFDEVFKTDSFEYEILTNAALKIKGVMGVVVEIGVRRGGSAKMIIDSLSSNSDTDRLMLCIDPYGNIDYPQTKLDYTNPQTKLDPKPDITMSKLDYTNLMRNETIPSLYHYAYSAGINFTFLCLEETEFFKRFADGVPQYKENKQMMTNYALVFFDGPHTDQILIEETDFFIPRSAIGTVFVFDDIWMYDHDMIEQKILFPSGFNILEKGKVKASYVKST